MVKFLHALLPALLFFSGLIAGRSLATEFITVQSTTSTQNSGFYEHVLPLFTQASGIDVRVVAVGTGQAIKNAQNCDGDVLLVHAKEAEEEFVAGGHGGPRYDLMYNDFVIAGPAADPAQIHGSHDAVESLKAISKAGAPFASRGDDSGTHKKELELWRRAGIDPAVFSGGWYRETGSGMGSTLNVAAGMNAYVLVDRASWVSFGNRGSLAIMVEGDAELYNQYGVIPVSGSKCSNVKSKSAKKFIDWLISKDGQAAINNYRIDGVQLFFANASKPQSD